MMSNVNQILCAYDFSQTSDRALAQAAALARRHDARLLIAHIVEPLPVSRSPVMRPPDSDLAIRVLAEKRIGEVAERLREEVGDVDLQVPIGQIGSEIVSIAAAQEADVVVIGTRGLSPIKHLLLGSTAEYVVRRSAMPVLAIHPEDPTLEPPIENVVVPTDLTVESAFAVDSLLELFPEKSLPRLHLVHADSIPPYLSPFSHAELKRAGYEDPTKADLLDRMEEAAEYASRAGFEVNREVIDGEPFSSIPAYAARVNAELIAMNTHGRSAVGNFLRGRIAQRVVQHAHCPVLAARASQK